MAWTLTARIGFPEQARCPDCGHWMDGTDDAIGVSYRCEQHDCGSFFDGEELFPQEDPSEGDE